MIEKRQLLCIFSNIDGFKNVIEQIQKFYSVYNNSIFVFYNVKNVKELYITYNIFNTDGSFPKFPNTISIHRKRQTNTLYTLNAMNQIIRDENNGVFDKTFQIGWEFYKDCLIMTDDNFVKIISIKIYDIIN